MWTVSYQHPIYRVNLIVHKKIEDLPGSVSLMTSLGFVVLGIEERRVAHVIPFEVRRFSF
jgi:hypothetical protein